MINRPYKFRAWHKVKNYMYKNIAIGLNGKILYSRGMPKKRGEDWYVSEECDENIIVMEFIGLRDDKNMDVWEGDILKVGAQGNLALVYWNTEGAKFELKFLDNKKTIDFADKRSLRSITVIGNIFENPEITGGKPLAQENLDESDDEREEEK